MGKLLLICERSLYKWLPIICGCHCRKDRSFHYRGKQFPVCARCTGEIAGFLLACGTGWLFCPRVSVLFLMLLPLIVDGGVQQLLSSYESSQWKRLVTGILFGYGGTLLIALSLAAVYRLGFQVGLSLRGNDLP